MRIASLIVVLVLLSALAAVAQSPTGTVRGTITSQVNGSALAGSSVKITQLSRSVETDERGVYEFRDLAPGRYTVVTHTDGFTDQVRSVDVAAGGVVTVDFAMSLTALREEVTVTVSGSEESVFESFQSVNSVGATQLREQIGNGIGEVLERESGIGKRSFGPGTSRPVIRGFDGDRVLVLQDGARNGSLGSQSGDHGEPIETLGLERLEVIKGPATLLYGSNAIGGVVNAVSSDEDDPHEGFRGSFTGLGATNNRQGGVSGGLEYGFKKLLFKVNGNFLREGDYRTPFGQVPNSSSRAYGSGTSLGYYADKGFLLGSFTMDRRRYGVPYAPLYEEGVLLTDEGEYDINAIQARFRNSLPDVPEEAIDLRMKRNNYRLRGGFRDVKGPIQRGNFHIDFTKYRHEEIETADDVDEVGTNFFNDTFSYRAMLEQKKYGSWSGRFGFDGFSRDYLNVGAEQLIDGKVKQKNFAAFALQEFDLKRVALQFGGRVETNRYDPINRTRYDARDFTGFSGAAGARFRLWNGASFVANLTSAYRAPAIEELYNEGPHIGTVTFEVGNQDLTRERSNGIEFSLRQRLNKVRLNGSFFYYGIKNFVFLAPEDDDNDGSVDVEDGLPIGLYRQADAKFVGADVSLDADLNKWLGFFAIADVVKAELRESGQPLPRITPAKLRLGLDFRNNGLSVRPEVIFTGSRKADDIFSLETPTDGYGLFNVNASYTIASEHVAHTFAFSTTNLGNKLYRNHLSFIKDLAPESGRGARFSYSVRFF